MGVTIHYRGRLRRPSDIQPFIDELEDICRSAEWEYKLHHFKDPEAKGIIFKPHERNDSVQFLFLEDGILTDVMDLEWGTKKEMPWLFTKTQFAGVDVHMALCHLFKYLGKRWFDVFEVDDEAGYYETGDSEEVKRQIDSINEAIKKITAGLEEADLGEGESIEERILKIIREVQKKMGGE